ncbi:hypothetical protein H0X06_01635 [Candidatus Dependentiae bacterium]|nr:hypothetical protein [Candidatus Dependentiae bacterium]
MIDLFFTVLNFAVFLGLVYYGWSRLLLPLVQATIKKESTDARDLHEEHRKILKECRQVEESIHAQNQECQELSSKVTLWRDSVEKTDHEKRDEQLFMKKKYEEKTEDQAKKNHRTLLYKKIKPLVLAHLEKDLAAHFKNTEIKRTYLNRLLKELES